MDHWQARPRRAPSGGQACVAPERLSVIPNDRSYYVKLFHMRRADGRRRFARRGYHHGNLKEALVSSAKQLILEKGPHGFSLVEAARLASVSPAAPYRHYRDRMALLAEVARRGFTRFADRLEAAWQGGAPDPDTALRRLGQAYIKFACEERASYAAMFMTGIDPEADPELKAESDRSFAVLLAAAEKIDRPSTSDPRLISLQIWAFSHGVATLFAQKPESHRESLPDPMVLLDSGIQLYLNGLKSHAAKSDLASDTS